MTNFYVRQSGSDAAAGTSAGAAWRTVAKAVATVASGDTVYIGAGVYRENVVLTQSFTSDTLFVGDVTGANTGDVGEVRLSGFVSGPNVTQISPLPIIGVRGKNFYHFQNIVFVAQTTCIDAITTTAGGTNWTFDDCAFLTLSAAAGASSITFTAIVDTTHTWAFNRCIVWHQSGVGLIVNIPTTATAADYDVDFQLNNCLVVVLANSNAVQVVGTGANSNKGGGVKIQSCTLFGTTSLRTTGAGLLSTTIPCTVYNSAMLSANSFVVATSGQVIEDYNVYQVTPSGVTAGVHSRQTNIETLMSLGQERIWGGQPRPAFSPVADSAVLGHGAATSPAPFTVDILGAPRPAGASRLLASGTATSGANNTLTDSGATFGQYLGAVIKITGGTGAGQVKTIKTNTGTAITVWSNWITNPDSTSTYLIYYGSIAETGKATSGTGTGLTVSNATWVTNQWRGFTVEITAGTGAGQTNTVSSSTATALVVPTWGTNPDSTSEFAIYRQTSVDALLPAVGCYERHDTAQRETALTDAGSVAAALYGKADQILHIAVNAESTTLAVRCSFDTAHGNGTKPTATLLANPEIGVTTETVTATGTAGSGTFETLTFAAQTPTAKGVVEVRLQGLSALAYGRVVFDTVSVT